MGSQNVTEITEELIQPILEEMNLELVDVEFTQEGKNYFLRVYVDKEGGVDIEECGQVSEQLSEKLDAEDPITFPYFLEVSSPGAERPLKKKEDFEKHVGHHVNVKVYNHIDEQTEFEGRLTAFENDTASIEVTVKTRKKTFEIPYDNIAKARLAVSFN